MIKQRISPLSLALYGALLLFPSLMEANNATEARKQREELARAVAFGFGSGDKLLWKHTHQPAQRDVLYQPLFNGSILKSNDQSLSLFFSRASNLCYGLGDLVDLKVVQSIAEQGLEMKFALEQADAAYEGADPEESPEALADYEAYLDEQANATTARAVAVADTIKSCAEQITFQEHRIGAALNKKWRYGQLCLSARTWLGLAERNYWLDQQYRDRISAAMKQIIPSNDGTFTLSDYVTMNWGMGDTHLKAAWVMPVADAIKYRAGAKVVLPTATEGKRGTAHQLIPLRLDEFAGYGRTRLNEVLISPRLGNGGHYGAGLWHALSWKTGLYDGKHALKLRGYAAVDYLFEAAEERLLMRYVDKEVVAARGSFRNSNDAKFRAFIGQFILPEPVDVVIAPGAIITMGATAQYTINKTRFFAGYDWYCKDIESVVRCVHHTDDVMYIPNQELVPAVKSSEHKLFGGVSYSAQHHNVVIGGFKWKQLGISAGIHGAASVRASGMGKEYSLGISVGWKC